MLWNFVFFAVFTSLFRFCVALCLCMCMYTIITIYVPNTRTWSGNTCTNACSGSSQWQGYAEQFPVARLSG